MTPFTRGTTSSGWAVHLKPQAKIWWETLGREMMSWTVEICFYSWKSVESIHKNVLQAAGFHLVNDFNAHVYIYFQVNYFNCTCSWNFHVTWWSCYLFWIMSCWCRAITHINSPTCRGTSWHHVVTSIGHGELEDDYWKIMTNQHFHSTALWIIGPSNYPLPNKL